MGAPVVHFEIMSPDTAPLAGFYSTLFGWELQHQPEMNYSLVYTRGGRGIDGGIGQADNSFVTFYAAVPDIEATLTRAEELGGKVVMPATEVPGVVTFAMFTDPQGHVVGVIKDSGTPPERGAGSGGAPVTHFEITAPDAKPLRGFYTDLFGWTVDADNQWEYGLVRTGSDAGIQGGIGSDSRGGADYVTVYVEVPDLEATLAKAKELGGTVAMPVTEIPGEVTMAQITDPQGHLIGLIRAT